jgi:hypothetical protein
MINSTGTNKDETMMGNENKGCINKHDRLLAKMNTIA